MKNYSGLAKTPMSVSARLEVDWSKTFHISVQKPQFLLIFVPGTFFCHQRFDIGPIFVKN